MDDFIKLSKEQAELLQEISQKFRERIDLIAKNDKEKEELMLAASVQFFVYALSPSNDRFIDVSLEKIHELLKKHQILVISTIIGVSNDKED